MIMTRGLRATALATAIVLTPLATSAGAAVSDNSASAVTDRANPSARPDASHPGAFSSPIHWAMIAVGVAFAGAAIYIHRRRGFDVDASD